MVRGGKRQFDLDWAEMPPKDDWACELGSWAGLDQRSLTHIFPAQSGLAVLAVDVGDGMEAREQHPLLGWSAAHVHPGGDMGAVEGMGSGIVKPFSILSL